MSTQTDMIREALEREIESHGDRMKMAVDSRLREDLTNRREKCRDALAALSELEAHPSEPRLTVDRALEVVLKWVYKSGEIDYNLITSLLPEERESGETKYVTDLRDRLTKAAQ